MPEKKKSMENAFPRHNKIYRCPKTPEPEFMLEKEKGFVLDCSATSSIATDYSKSHPKLGPVVPPYNSQKDGHVKNYFGYYGVDKTLEKTGQDDIGCSIEGEAMDSFHERGAGFQYLQLRNQHGAGHCPESVDGHAQFMKGVKPVVGWNGANGFRRNTPWLRWNPGPSPFGTASRSPTH